MKKRYLALLTAAVMLTAAGCSDPGTDAEEKKAKDITIETEAPQMEDDPNQKAGGTEETAATDGAAVEETPAMDVSGDSYEIADIFSSIGMPGEEVQKIVGAQSAADTYQTQLFGADAELKVTMEEGTVQSIQMSFSGTPKESLVNAVSEQTGQDGQEAGDGKVSWDFDGKTAVLEETETGCLINISIGEKAQ